MNRVELLKDYCLNEPENPFNWYALALELKKIYPDEARPVFEKLLTEFKDYEAQYYASAAFFAEIGDLDKAKAVYEQGLKTTSANPASKAYKELKSAYDMFLFENFD